MNDKTNTPGPSGDNAFGPDDKTLQQQLAEYKKALEQEYESTGGNALDTDRLDPTTNVERFTRDFFRKNIAQAAAQVVWLSANSTSDAVRLNACKIIIKEALEDAKREGDPIKELFEALKID